MSASIDCALILFFSLSRAHTVSEGNAPEMWFDCSCPMFLLQCRRILLVLKLISAADDFRELRKLPDFVCLEYNLQTLLEAEWSSSSVDRGHKEKEHLFSRS